MKVEINENHYKKSDLEIKRNEECECLKEKCTKKCVKSETTHKSENEGDK